MGLRIAWAAAESVHPCPQGGGPRLPGGGDRVARGDRIGYRQRRRQTLLPTQPVFRALGAGDVALTVVVFAVGVAAWCLVGAWLVSHRRITHVIQVWGHWIIPAVFILIGLYAFYKAGIFGG